MTNSKPSETKCFPKNERLLKRAQFLELSEDAGKRQNKYFIIRFQQGQQIQSRLGVTVTKKVGKAVTRNRIKRHIREYFRNNKHRLNGSWDINLIAKQTAEGLASQQIPECLADLFNKIEY